MMFALLALAQNEVTDQVAQDSGAVGVIGFIIVGFLAVAGAAIYRRRKG